MNLPGLVRENRQAVVDAELLRRGGRGVYDRLTALEPPGRNPRW